MDFCMVFDFLSSTYPQPQLKILIKGYQGFFFYINNFWHYLMPEYWYWGNENQIGFLWEVSYENTVRFWDCTLITKCPREKCLELLIISIAARQNFMYFIILNKCDSILKMWPVFHEKIISKYRIQYRIQYYLFILYKIKKLSVSGVIWWVLTKYILSNLNKSI